MWQWLVSTKIGCFMLGTGWLVLLGAVVWWIYQGQITPQWLYGLVALLAGGGGLHLAITRTNNGKNGNGNGNGAPPAPH